MSPDYRKQLQDAIATVTTGRKDTLEYDIAVNMVANAAHMLLRQERPKEELRIVPENY